MHFVQVIILNKYVEALIPFGALCGFDPFIPFLFFVLAVCSQPRRLLLLGCRWKLVCLVRWFDLSHTSSWHVAAIRKQIMEDWFHEKVNMHVNNTLMAKHAALYLHPHEAKRLWTRAGILQLCRKYLLVSAHLLRFSKVLLALFCRGLNVSFMCLSLLICVASSVEPGIIKTTWSSAGLIHLY